VTPHATAVPDLVLWKTAVHADARGSFTRTFCAEAFAGFGFKPLQTSLSHNHRRHTLRGLHFQAPPHEEAKLVRCVAGTILDVAVDLRPGSPTRLRHVALELSASRADALLIPRGFAHGFMTLTDEALVEYMIDAPYTPAAGSGFRFDDPALGIAWPAVPAVIAERDLAWPLLGDG
jgi:dTDP-4-dehydrorhamnose 3,5-epimerase